MMSHYQTDKESQVFSAENTAYTPKGTTETPAEYKKAENPSPYEGDPPDKNESYTVPYEEVS